jgi:RimJ/RimL family protein N-acetyltransferase
MKIVDYSKDTMGEDVARLFGEIYPGWSSEDVQRVLYDEKSPLHVATKVAIIKNRAVGQTNVFLLQHKKSIANIGYHVHPCYQRQGIAQRLTLEVIRAAKEKGVETIVVQTERANIAAISLARKLGFSEASPKFTAENTNCLKLHRLKNGILLCKHI